MEKILSHMRARDFYDGNDQPLINHYIDSFGLRHEKIPTEYYIWATYFHPHPNVIFHHAVCTCNTDMKVDQLREIRALYDEHHGTANNLGEAAKA
jgi:hypothetical protein